MPTFQTSQSILNPISILDNLFELLMLDSTLVSSSATSAAFDIGTSTIEITGDGFVFDSSGPRTELVGGTIDTLHFAFSRPGYFYTLSELDLDAATLSAAAAQEDSGADPGAIEALIYPMDWTLYGNSLGDVILKDHQSIDGIPVSFSGDNTIWLEYGYDRFHAGAGNDTVHGGMLDDILWGGAGRDRLYGGAQHDTLFGNGGPDRLFGGNGSDQLNGGGGRDTLVGGRGNDDLRGGRDADRFVFNAAVLPEEDTIHDFEIDLDKIVIRSAGDIALSDTASGVDITDGLRIIHVLGVTSDDLDSGNLLLPAV
ncbi:calcium-binding protein [Sedimentitalea sp. JM2-8]|uniref:Calcium-binding protein n=1 Tax=Sedimentitalea xiamensis TaxID=3050037 RepID=A0ABT7FDV6_9RHOB|nr:calcium-binding protein [Sedimentitalea xiamensis]MDK3073294.1 calcium-binding protein [Sedimentitalea xiamensis]